MSRQVAQSTAPANAAAPAARDLLQRKCACGTHTAAASKCEACERASGPLQRKAANQGASGDVPSIVHDVLRSSGQPLDAATRAFMEPRFVHDFSNVRSTNGARGSAPLTVVPPHDRSEHEADEIARRVAHSHSAARQTNSGYDFSSVRVHTNPVAASSARALNARAYNVGNDIVFAAGQYSTATSSGRELIAHELAHVAQARANPSSEIKRALHCKRFDTNEADCTATMGYLVQLIFQDHEKDTWDSTSTTKGLARKATFRSKFKQSIEDTFNGGAFLIKPDVASFQSGRVVKEEKPCPCAEQGFEPKVHIDLVKDGEWSTKEDWEVDVEANPSAQVLESSSSTSYGTVNEADVTPVPKKSSGPGVAQTTVVHEFGHFIGLDHPGEGLEGGVFSKSQLSPGANEYGHTGKDAQGRDVTGPSDLMGSGMGLRPFYFDNWRNELNDKYGDGCGWKIK
jgi:hypothetical protein